MPTPDFESICHRIKTRREALGLSQRALGKIVKVSQASVSSWEDGTVPRGGALIDLAKALGVTVEWLRDGSDDQGSEKPGELIMGQVHFHLPVMPPGSAMTLTLPGGQIITLRGHQV